MEEQFSGEAVYCLLCGAVEEMVEHFVVECGGLRETRERCGVNAGVSVEQALLFEGRSEEGMERYTRMLDEMWKERRRLMGSGGVSGFLGRRKRREELRFSC